MMAYQNTSWYMHTLLLTLLFGMTIEGLFLLGQKLIYRKGQLRFQTAVLSLFTAISFVLLILLYQEVEAMEDGGFPVGFAVVGCVPVFVYFLFCAFNMYTIVWYIQSDNVMKRKSINRKTIKEAIDNVNSGVCIYNEQGRILLSNRTMNQLHFELLGEGLKNGVLFWKWITESYPTQAENYEVVRADGSIWNLSCTKQENEMYKIVATDVTQLNQLSKQIREKNQELRRVQARLVQYEKEVDDLTKAKERLEVKAKVHNRFGHLLLQTRHALHEQSQKEEWNRILDEWQVQTIVFMQEKDTDANHDWKQLLDSAKAIGLTVNVEGRIPKEKEALDILIAASIECITNAVKHAYAKQLFIQIVYRNHQVEFTFANDGSKPDGPIRLGGGLENLKKRVEDVYGTFELVDQPTYQLKITMMSGEES